MASNPSHTQALSATGLNLIRIAIAAYFIAVALDWADGFHKGALFQHFSTSDIAHFIGSMLLFYLAFVYLCGFQLRMSALFLALFVLSSSFVDAFIFNQGQSLGTTGLWRDLAFVCAILLSYASLSRRDMRRVSVVREKVQVRSFKSKKMVQPNRVLSTQVSSPSEFVAPKPEAPSKEAAQDTDEGDRDDTESASKKKADSGENHNIFV